MTTHVHATPARSTELSFVQRHPRLQRWLRNNGAPLMMSLPALLLLFVFAYLPMFGIIIAFKEYRFDEGILGSHWIGLTNFKFLFGTDSLGRDLFSRVLYGARMALLVGLAAQKSYQEGRPVKVAEIG